MDYKKIGNFIKEERKSKNLTQAKLAEKLFVSEKTVSKWENGNGLPDTKDLPKLCEIFGVSLNEILAGEKIVIENNGQKNEQLLLEMVKEIRQKNKTIWTSMWVLMIVSLFGFISCCLIAAYLIPQEGWKLAIIIGACVLFLLPCFYALKLEVSVGAYRCKHCEYEIVPTYTEALWAMHKGTTRYLKCPNCNKRSWCKKVIKK